MMPAPFAPRPGLGVCRMAYGRLRYSLSMQGPRSSSARRWCRRGRA